MSFQNEPIITTIEKPKPIKGGVDLAIIYCTWPLPIKHVEVPIIVVSIHVEALEEHVIPEPIPLVIPEIGVGEEVTLIDIVTHVF
jgi:hypothetical protein